MHYLDNAATTRVDTAVADTVNTVLRTHFANPSSLYAPGAQSEAVLQTARAQVARSLRCAPAQVYFTASGTEGNNLAVQGAVRARSAWADHIIATGYEHPSVHNAVAALEREGWRVTWVMPDAHGHVDCAQILDAVGAKTALVAAMHVNNEIGTLLDVASLASAVKEKNRRTAVHADGVQAWGKRPLALEASQVDSYTVSGHKIHAPKGIGALYLRKGYHIAPTLFGGAQENGFRPGTENLAYAAALGEAATHLQPQASAAQFAALCARLRSALADIDGLVYNSPDDALPCMVNFSVPGIKSETMLHFLEAHDVYVSSGSACSKGAPSHTLTAMALPKARVDSALRVSFCIDTTYEDIEALAQGIQAGVATLARMRR